MSYKPDRRLVAVLALLALTVLGVAVGSRWLVPLSRGQYLRLLDTGDEHAARAERTAAVATYQEAARLQPDDPLPYLRLAQVYLDWGRSAEALDALARGAQLGADELEMERMQVAVQVARGDWPAVIHHGQRLLALAEIGEPETRGLRHTLARGYVELQEWEAARAEYETLAGGDLSDAVARERLGVLLLADDPADGVRQLFGAGTDLASRLLAVLQEPGAAGNPAYVSARLGGVLLEDGEWALAARFFEQAVSQDPDYPDARAYLGYTLDQLGRSEEARAHLLRAVELAPYSPVAHTFLGLHYDRLGGVASARAEYELAYDLSPDNPAICVEIGQAWAIEGRYVAAEIWLREAVSLQPDDPALWEILTRFYLVHNIGADGRAIEAATELVRLLPEEGRAHDLYGWAALQSGDVDGARESLLRAVSLDPALASAHYHLGVLWAADGAYEKAQGGFVRALDLDTTGEVTALVERAMAEIR